MITKRMEQALNEQINKEFYSAYLYLAMAAYCNKTGLPGAEHWFRIQYSEEIIHMTKMFDYVMQHGGEARLMQIAEPPHEFGSFLEIFQTGLKHEQFVTQSINNVLNIAVEEKDHATQIFMQWFVTEQVEEEANSTDIINRLKLARDNGGALLMIDEKLSQRLPPAPAAAANA